MKKYYLLHFTGLKPISKKRFLKLEYQNFEHDYITWYDDGENIFIGVCNLSEKDVIFEIVETTGQFKSEFAMWY